MAKKKVNYENFYKAGQQVKVGVRLTASVMREYNGEILSLKDDRIQVEIIGDMPSALSGEKGDARFPVSGWSGWGGCCDTVLDAHLAPKDLSLLLEGEVEDKQRREY